MVEGRVPGGVVAALVFFALRGAQVTVQDGLSVAHVSTPKGLADMVGVGESTVLERMREVRDVLLWVVDLLPAGGQAAPAQTSLRYRPKGIDLASSVCRSRRAFHCALFGVVSFGVVGFDFFFFWFRLVWLFLYRCACVRVCLCVCLFFFSQLFVIFFVLFDYHYPFLFYGIYGVFFLK